MAVATTGCSKVAGQLRVQLPGSSACGGAVSTLLLLLLLHHAHLFCSNNSLCCYCRARHIGLAERQQQSVHSCCCSNSFDGHFIMMVCGRL